MSLLKVKLTEAHPCQMLTSGKNNFTWVKHTKKLFESAESIFSLSGVLICLLQVFPHTIPIYILGHQRS